MSAMTDTALSPEASRQRYPDFFIVGHHKSGTTALYEMLRRHPQIFMPDLKEPRFLASDMRSRFRNEREAPHPQTLEAYLALFAPAEEHQLVGEASATYLWSHTAAERIAEVQPAARLIAILREPASFLRSLHMTFLRGQVESQPDLRKALALEGPRSEGRRIPRRSHLPQLLQYSDQVRYTEQLRRYERHFPREQLLVLIYDDFRADTEGTVRQVMRFLEVDDSAPVEVLERNVTTKILRAPQTDDLVHSLSMGRGRLARAGNRAVKALTTQGLRHGALGTLRRRVVSGEPPPADEAFMQELRRRYKHEVEAVSDYLGRDLVSLWVYDKLA
jgi:sulfotransferase family protein